MSDQPCPKCPCPDSCLRRADFCAWAMAEAPDPVQLRHICRRAEVAAAPTTAYPSLAAQASGALGAIGRVAAATLRGEKVAVDRAEQGRRLEICRQCPEFDPGPTRCRKCGCSLPLKARLETEHCPLGEW